MIEEAMSQPEKEQCYNESDALNLHSDALLSNNEEQSRMEANLLSQLETFGEKPQEKGAELGKEQTPSKKGASMQSHTDKENTLGINSDAGFLHKSQSYHEKYELPQYDEGSQLEQRNNPLQAMTGELLVKQKKRAKKSSSKDVKIMQTMKAYFPTLNQVKEKKKTMFPPPQPRFNPQRSSTTGSNPQPGPSKLVPYSERIIFAESKAGQNYESKRKSSALKTMNQQPHTLLVSHSQQNSQVASTYSASMKKPHQLPPIDKRSNYEKSSDQLNKSTASPNSKLFSPLNDSQGQQQPELASKQSFSEKKVLNYKMASFETKETDLQEGQFVEAKGKGEEEGLKDYEKKNQDRILQMQEKKALEMKMIDEERKKMIKKQEKLKLMILKQAAENRERRAAELQMRQEEESKNQKKTPKKKIQVQVQQEAEDDQEKKKKLEIMQKYYRSRYSTFLKALTDQNKKKEQQVEDMRKAEEKKKAKLKEELGVVNVQSRFKEEMIQAKAEAKKEEEKKEEPKKVGKAPLKRGHSMIGGMASTGTRFSRDDQSLDLGKTLEKTLDKKKEKSKSKKKRALTPKIKKRVVQIAEVIEEKQEVDQEEKARLKREAAEKIKQRQQKYLQDLQERKDKEQAKAKEEKKKKDKQLQMAREQAKQNFEKVNNQPGLKDLQEKQEEYNQDSEEKPKKKKKHDNPIDNFLERNNPKRTVFPNITDLTTWKKKYRVEENTKVFICRGGYPDIKKALKRRGWVENKDPTSPCFDLKWVLKSKDIDHNELNDSQLVNHFNKAAAITTKVGLCHNLKNLIWFNNVDIDTFYPRCFDLAIQDELEDFVEEFKAMKAEGYVKVFVREMRENQQTTVAAPVLKVAMKVCERRLKDLDDLIDEAQAFGQLISDEEWRILGADELNMETLAQKKHEEWMAKNDMMHNKKPEKKGDKKKRKKKPKKQEENQEEEEKGEEEEEEEDNEQDLDAQLSQKNPEFKRALKILEGLKAKFPQFSLNGEKNIWIIKPAGSSRGRGIVLYKQLVEILDLCKSKESQFIAQKYIENTMIVKQRKFDIRQWVLVTDWNPLTVWLYNEPYFRFPATDYNPDNINDRFIHLTNNSVAKYAEGSKVTHDIEGNMMSLGEFQEFLVEEYGWDVWEDKLREQSKNIVINCLESVQDMFECKKGCFELFGFDLMVDDDFNMWLIEVNSSPAMDYSTKVTERLVKMVLEDSVKVVVDYEQAKKKSKVDTGLFECIYKAKRIVDKPMQSFGLNLVCEGKKIAPYRLSNY